jgi:glucosamine--fructose-6-phosphate aminotransferase (isomerizing)
MIKNSYRLMRIEASRNELLHQPQALIDTLTYIRNEIAAWEKPIIQPQKIILAGCGDSYYSSLAMQTAIFAITGIDTEACQAYEFSKFPHSRIDQRTLIIGLSSSGKTQAILDVFKFAKTRGALTIALTNSSGSPADRAADRVLHIQATRVGWPTQASTSAMAALVELAFALSASSANSDLKEDFARIPQLMQEVIAGWDSPMQELAQSLLNRKTYFYSGAGPSWGVSNFGAAKIKEWSQDYAFAIHLEEFHHFMSLRRDDPIFVIIPHGDTLSRGKDTVEEAKRSGGQAIVISDGNLDFADLASKLIVLPQAAEIFSPFLTVIPLQLFALHLVHAKMNAGWSRPLEGDREFD